MLILAIVTIKELPCQKAALLSQKQKEIQQMRAHWQSQIGKSEECAPLAFS